MLDWLRESFLHPWVLLHLPLALLVWRPWPRRARSVAVLYSSLDPLCDAPVTWTVRLRRWLPLLRVLAVILLIVCLARPRKGNEQTRVDTEGVAIQIVVDRSGSMQAMDFRIDGQRVNRLEAVKKVVRDFVLGGGGRLRGRHDDLVGLIVFGTYADSLCPLTLGHEFLVETLRQVEVATTREEGATAIGDAIALGVERLRAVEQQRGLRPAQKIKSKIIILLTDGENTAGDIAPLKAAEMAAAFDIRVYTIGAGTRGLAPMPTINPFTGETVLTQARVNIDEETLTKIADATGGKYFRATDTDSLESVYAEIDRLEKTQTEVRRYTEYKEMAIEWVTLGRVTIPPLLPIAFGLVALEVILGSTVLRKAP
ncbi:MAG: VWA domain-containing protein [Phycisphaerae bacterium]|nr:VWA domain-containing protein [Phycisphaerae bacterium]NUQ46379.1 VWA domain-containing protein [Phycisphaerae bacterium]